jgi:hypothetical protein
MTISNGNRDMDIAFDYMIDISGELYESISTISLQLFLRAGVSSSTFSFSGCTQRIYSDAPGEKKARIPRK